MMWGLGYSITSLFKLNKFNNNIEKNIMQLGIGLGTFPIFSIILNTIKIPLTWYIFLLLGFIIPLKDLYFYIREKDKEWKFKFNLKKINIAILIVFIIFFCHLFVYLKGSFVIEHLEDGDPLQHADVSQYIGEYKTYSLTKENKDELHYTEPYPPGFAIINGMLYQIDSDMKGILKFFNSFIISLGILFIFFFMAILLKSENKGIFGAFLLAVIPCYLSHFIFATSLAVTLFFPAFYALIRINEDKKWLYIAGIISASIFISQPIAAGVFGVMLGVYWLVGVILYKNIQKNILLSIIISIMLSCIFYVTAFIKFGFETFASKMGFYMFLAEHKEAASYGRYYGFINYLISPIQNLIDQPFGFGPLLFITLLVCLLFFALIIKQLYLSENKERSHWIIFSYIIFILTFLATQSNHFPYTFFPSRVWCYMAVASVLLVSMGVFIISDTLNIKKETKRMIFILLIFGILITSGVPKYIIQTMVWAPDYNLYPPVEKDGNIYSPEVAGYLWMEHNVPWKSNTMPLCNIDDRSSAAYNMGSQTEDKEIREFKRYIKGKTGEEIVNFARSKNYKYITLGLRCISKNILTSNEIQSILNDFNNLNIEAVYIDNNGMFIFKL